MTYVRLIATANENRRRRRRVRVRRASRGWLARPFGFCRAIYLDFTTLLAGVSGSTQIGKLGSTRLGRRNPKPWERQRRSRRISCRRPTLRVPSRGRETTPRDHWSPSIIIVNYHASVRRFGR